MEGRSDIVPRSGEEKEIFRRGIIERESELQYMLESGQAYVQDEFDKNGRIKTLKVYKKDGELLYFKDVAGLDEAEAKLRGNKLH